jgi:hypothetical protein
MMSTSTFASTVELLKEKTKAKLGTRKSRKSEERKRESERSEKAVAADVWQSMALKK